MPQRSFSRAQSFLVPPAFDDWLPADHAARFVATLLDGFPAETWQELGIARTAKQTGAPRYAPEALLAIWVYGFMCGIRSVRGLEAACRDQIPFRWLSGNQTPDHNTLARFYQSHRSAMAGIFKQTVTIAVRAGMVDWAVQAVDGTRIAANASVTRSLDEEHLAALLVRVEQRIAELEDQQVATEDGGPPPLPPALQDATVRKERIAAALAQVRAAGGPAKVNLTDSEARIMKTRHGLAPAYNAQAVVASTTAGAGRLIVAATVTTASNDLGLLEEMIATAEATSGQTATVTVADAGYHTTASLVACAEKGVTVVVPDKVRHAMAGQRAGAPVRFPRSAFGYDSVTDTYTCPAGQVLTRRGSKLNEAGTPVQFIYRVGLPTCRVCALMAHCTTNQRIGRQLKIPVGLAVRERHELWMASEEAKALSRRRRGLIEPVFGILKERFAARRWQRRGLGKVQSEWHLLAAAFNLRTLSRCWFAFGAATRPLTA